MPISIASIWFCIGLLRRITSAFILFIFFAFAISAHAEAPYFWASQQPPPQYPKYYSASEACDNSDAMQYGFLYYELKYLYFDSSYNPRPGGLAQVNCEYYRLSDDGSLGYLGLNYVSGDCPTGENLNSRSGECEAPDQESKRKALGEQDPKLSCSSPSALVADPINSTNGNNYQVEADYRSLDGASGLSFVRYYNSLSGLWTHNYSYGLWITNDIITVSFANGRQSQFTRSGSSITPESTEFGRLVQVASNWVYTSSTQDVMTFNGAGQLISLRPKGQIAQTLSYSDSQITVTDAQGHMLSFAQDSKYQPLSLQAGDLSIAYTYNGTGHLAHLSRTQGGATQTSQYVYEVVGKPGLLTGIIDERGVRYVSWGYDEQGRANFNELSNGVEKTELTYNADGSTRVTNPLGKQTVYRYQVIQGVKRIVAIEGEPTPDCPASNSTYTYNDRGQVLTKTDAKGLITSYAYNDRGLEISRTEAIGTPLARTTTTEWDPVRFLPTRVVDPTRTTVYSYDDQGWELSRQTNPIEQ